MHVSSCLTPPPSRCRLACCFLCFTSMIISSCCFDVRALHKKAVQVRFGVLNAGNFGVAQSRKRTIIIAAAPDETMPDWPEAMYVFASPQLTINLPGGVRTACDRTQLRQACGAIADGC